MLYFALVSGKPKDERKYPRKFVSMYIALILMRYCAHIVYVIVMDFYWANTIRFEAYSLEMAYVYCTIVTSLATSGHKKMTSHVPCIALH